MPDREKPLKARTEQDDESARQSAEHHGKHKAEKDEPLPEEGSEKGGLKQESDKDAR